MIRFTSAHWISAPGMHIKPDYKFYVSTEHADCRSTNNLLKRIMFALGKFVQ